MSFLKICGIKDLKTAELCLNLDVNALGFIFYPESPRFIKAEEAKIITEKINDKVLSVAVMVNPELNEAVEIANKASCKAIQLHGNESPELLAKLKKAGFYLIKALYLEKEPSIKSAANYPADCFLIEARPGLMPGGNAQSWEWERAGDFFKSYKGLLAGGLKRENIREAIENARPFGVDLSSGLEKSPGIKDHEKIIDFVKDFKNIKNF